MDLPSSWLDQDGAARVIVGLAGPGVLKTVKTVSVGVGVETLAEIAVDTGSMLAGCVLDPDGLPVAGLGLVARRSRGPQGLKFAGAFDTDEVLFSGHKFEEGRAVTDVDGTFQMAGLRYRTYFLACTDPSWILLPESRAEVESTKGGLELRVARTRRFRVHVRDESTGRAIDAASVRVVLRGPGGGERHFSIPIRKGEGEVAWLPWGPGRDAPIDLDLVATARGYLARTTSATVARGQSAGKISLDLTPATMGDAIVLVRHGNGLPARGRFLIRCQREGEEETLPLQPTRNPGTYAIRLPVGDWRVTVFPNKAFLIASVSWTGELRVPAVGCGRVVAVLPEYGRLVVDRGEHVGLLLEIRVNGQRVITGVSEANSIFPAILPGEWPYIARGKDGVLQQGVIRITAWETTTLTIGDE
ncbi:MAG: hypothetical protein ACC662_09670 [Planctomycetota bacterium]